MKIAVFETGQDEIAELKRLSARFGFEASLHERALSGDTLNLAEDCEAVSTLGRSRLDAAMLQALAKLGVRYLSTRTVGTDHIDIAAAHACGIRCSHATYPPDAVAEFTVMLMLMALRKYKPALWRQQVNDYSLGGLMGRSLKAQTVGLIGLGSIGGTVARYLSGFGCRLLAYNRSQKPEYEGLVTYVGLDELFRQSDIISLHIPFTPETRRIIDREAVSRMKDGVILINTARGDLMDTEAVIEGIETEKIGGLAMDVFSNEKGIYHADRRNDILRNKDMVYLRQFPNVILTQHMAFYTENSIVAMVDTGIQGLLDMAAGRETSLELR